MGRILPSLMLLVVIVCGCGRPKGAVGMTEESNAADRGARRVEVVAAWNWFHDNVLLKALSGSTQPETSLGQVVSEDALQLFVAAGRDVTPQLVPYVGDERMTPLVVTYPLSSYIGPTLRVGQIASYLIEVALRQNPYFTTTGHLLGSLDEAAQSYRDWLERCYDPVADRWKCPSDDLPVIQWDYDPNGLSRLQSVRGQSSR
jgi:hypothetical protein